MGKCQSSFTVAASAQFSMSIKPQKLPPLNKLTNETDNFQNFCLSVIHPFFSTFCFGFVVCDPQIPSPQTFVRMFNCPRSRTFNFTPASHRLWRPPGGQAHGCDKPLRALSKHTDGTTSMNDQHDESWIISHAHNSKSIKATLGLSMGKDIFCAYRRKIQ